jgi:transcription termination factor NusB
VFYILKAMNTHQNRVHCLEKLHKAKVPARANSEVTLMERSMLLVAYLELFKQHAVLYDVDAEHTVNLHKNFLNSGTRSFFWSIRSYF